MSRRHLAVVALALLIACDRKPAPPPPPSTTPGPGEQITGSERLGWDQRATNAAELATFRYAMYVDGTRSELTGVSCASAPANGSFACSARLPTLTRGNHTLELAAFVVEGTVVESARSPAFQVTVVASASSQAGDTPSSFRGGLFDSGGEPLAIDLVADGFDRPADLAFAPDGRLFVADRNGRIRVVGNGAVEDRPALTLAPENGERSLLAIAVDPEFARTRHVYVLHTAHQQGERQTFVVARFREAGGTLADRVVVLDDVPASATAPSGGLRFGPDRKLYVALDDGDDRSRAEDRASWNGKLLRLNADGTTPADQDAGSPLFAWAFHAPAGFDWHRGANVIWTADREPGGGDRIAAVRVGDGRLKRGVMLPPVRLPDRADAAAVVVYGDGPVESLRNSVLVASADAEQLLQLKLDLSDPTRIVSSRRLLHHRVGALRALAISPDGAVYFATDSAIGRLGRRNQTKR